MIVRNGDKMNIMFHDEYLMSSWVDNIVFYKSDLFRVMNNGLFNIFSSFLRTYKFDRWFVSIIPIGIDYLNCFDGSLYYIYDLNGSLVVDNGFKGVITISDGVCLVIDTNNISRVLDLYNRDYIIDNDYVYIDNIDSYYICSKSSKKVIHNSDGNILVSSCDYVYPKVINDVLIYVIDDLHYIIMGGIHIDIGFTNFDEYDNRLYLYLDSFVYIFSKNLLRINII